MANDAPTITIPRHANESASAYDARVRYVTMGPGRSIDKVGDQLGIRTGSKRVSRLLEWSGRFEWVDSARRYDDAVAYVTIQESAAQYRKDLEDHRQRYGKSGRELHALANTYIRKLADRLRSLDSADITPGRIANDVRTVAAALTVAADLEAHALRVADLLPRLADDSGE
jgi:hypothetical protein